MRKFAFPALLTLLLLAVAAPICFAADVAASVAPAVQGDGWFTADFVRTVLSVSIGGLISGLVALGLAIITNKNAIKLDQQRIAAEKEKLELEFKFKKQEQDDIAKRQRECEFIKEKERHCKALVDILKPNNVIRGLSTDETDLVTSALLYISKEKYFPYVQRIFCLTTEKECLRNIESYFDNEKDVMSDEEIILWSKLRVYWGALVFVTQNELQDKKILSVDEVADMEAILLEQFCAEEKQRAAEPATTADKVDP